MKKIISALSCTLLTSLAAAPAPTPPPAQKCCDMTYEIYGELLFLQPNGSNLYYAAEAIPFDPSIAVPAASPNWNIFEISPHYRFGFEVGTKFLFPRSSMSIVVNWERLHSKENRSFKTPLATDMLGPFFDIGPNSAAYTTTKGEGTFHFDMVDLLFGKKVCFPNLHTNMYAGASFARIKQTMQSEFGDRTGNVSRAVNAPSTFTGAGPQFSVDFNYRLGTDVVYFTGSSSISLLMGQMQNSTTYTSFTPTLASLGIPQPNVQKTTVPNRAQLVPGFEEKLGFCFVADFGNCCKMMFDLGYQFQIYLNAVQSVDMTSQVLPALFTTSPTVGVFAQGFTRTLSNFILTGPYFSVNVDF